MSGEELWQFFCVYGINKGLVYFTVWVIVIVFLSILYQKNRIFSKKDFYCAVGPFLASKIHKLFLWAMTVVMWAGSINVLEDLFGIHRLILSFILFFAIIFLTKGGNKGWIALSKIIIPLIMVLGIYMFFQTITTKTYSPPPTSSKKDLLWGFLLYTGYNFFGAVWGFEGINKSNNPLTPLGCFLGGLIIGLYGCGTIILGCLYKNGPDPVTLNVAGQISYQFKAIWAVLLAAGMTTKAISLTATADLTKKGRLIYVAFACILGNLGFAKIINIIYPLFGSIGLFLLVYTFLIKQIKRQAN